MKNENLRRQKSMKRQPKRIDRFFIGTTPLNESLGKHIYFEHNGKMIDVGFIGDYGIVFYKDKVLVKKGSVLQKTEYIQLR